MLKHLVLKIVRQPRSIVAIQKLAKLNNWILFAEVCFLCKSPLYSSARTFLVNRNSRRAIKWKPCNLLSQEIEKTKKKRFLINGQVLLQASSRQLGTQRNRLQDTIYKYIHSPLRKINSNIFNVRYFTPFELVQVLCSCSPLEQKYSFYQVVRYLNSHFVLKVQLQYNGKKCQLKDRTAWKMNKNNICETRRN